MSLKEVKFWYWLVQFLPKKVRYFVVMDVWAKATTVNFPDKSPDEVTWSMAVKTIGVK